MRATRLLLTVTLSSLLLPQQGEVRVPKGFNKSIDFVEPDSKDYMDETERRAYMKGFMNGLFISPVLGARERDAQGYNRCLEDMTDAQLAAIVVKFINDHPDLWHESLSSSSYAAMRKVCQPFIDQQK